MVLGVDPGTLVTGYGVVRRDASGLRLLDAGAVRNRPGAPMPERLLAIHTALRRLMDAHRPSHVAVESAFYGKNAQSALKLGHARGVALLAAAERSIPAAEYSPREVKKAVAGNGGARKEQVRYMVQALLGLRRGTMPLDVSDALAVALCHLHRGGTAASPRGGWKAFVEAHPERVVR